MEIKAIYAFHLQMKEQVTLDVFEVIGSAP